MFGVLILITLASSASAAFDPKLVHSAIPALDPKLVHTPEKNATQTSPTTFLASAAAALDSKLLHSAIHASEKNATQTSPTTFLANRAEPKNELMPPSDSESLDLTAKEMEEAVMNLMLGKSAFGATPMGSSVQKIINIIKKTMEPKVLDAKESDQKQLDKLAAEINRCGTEKKSALRVVSTKLVKYQKESSLHKKCRTKEASLYTSKQNCLSEQASLYSVKKLKCKAFAMISKQWGQTKANAAIVKKAGSESVENYITRVSTTFCGKHVHGSKGRTSRRGGWGGGLQDGMLDQYLQAKDACAKATKAWSAKVKQCKREISVYTTKKGQCNTVQNFMDKAACKRAVLAKDACEAYAGCYFDKKKAYAVTEGKVRFNEVDRRAEWRGLKRIGCLIDAFADGKVSSKEIEVCKNATHSTTLLDIDYPRIASPEKCVVPNIYPANDLYKKKEFAPLPAVAKGRESMECTGMEEISLTPRSGSPSSCKCERVTMNGYYSAGPLVKCSKCLDVRRSTQKNSCPVGTKLFSPATRRDWKTFLASAQPLSDPQFIVDVTRPQNGCGGCTRHAMNSGSSAQSSWHTSDGSAWWLRSTRYNEPNGDYNANCFLRIKSISSENQITINDARCNYHSKSYYCQKEKVDLTPRSGSPKSCKCSQVTLAGKYSAGSLVKCENCLDVSKSTQKNSCPLGMKLFSPRSRGDWKTFLKSAGPLRAPNWIVDVTRPSNGCGGCTRSPMRSKQASQATWRTADGSPWWLRSTKYSEPNGDYNANCYLDLWKTPSDENNIMFNDWHCKYHARSYYCQPQKMEKIKPIPEPVIRMVVNPSLLKNGLLESQYYFTQNGKCLGLNSNRIADRMRQVGSVNYGNTGGTWSGFQSNRNFAATWQGVMLIKTTGQYTLSIGSDDGSKLYVDKKLKVNNDGYHAYRTRTATLKLDSLQHHVSVSYFQGSGYNGMSLKYKGPDTGNAMKVVPNSVLKYKQPMGFKEEVFYTGRRNRVRDVIRGSPTQTRLVHRVAYSSTSRTWPQFRASDGFGCRWTGNLQVTQGGTYRFWIQSDDGSILYVSNRMLVNNDGLHGMRTRVGNKRIASNRQVGLRLEYFEKGGGAGMILKYQGPDTRNRLKVMPSKVVVAPF